MEPIPFGKLSSWKDCSGKIRWYVRYNGRSIPRARIVMMNYLHTNHLPARLHVHHINGDTECDEIWNLMLLSNKQHACLHHPATFSTPYEYEKNRRLKAEVQEAIRVNSLAWYHRNKDKVNSNPLIKEYKKEWYVDNREEILAKLKNRYDTDEEYKANCKRRSKEHKAKKRLEKKQKEIL